MGNHVTNVKFRSRNILGTYTHEDKYDFMTSNDTVFKENKAYI